MKNFLISNFYYIYKYLFLIFIPKSFYKHLISFFYKLILFTERYIYNEPNIKKLIIENIKFKLYIGAKNSLSYGKMEKGEKIYEYPLIKCLHSIFKIEKNPIFMDIGSFQGYYAIYVSKLLNNPSTVYAVESNSEYCKHIKKSVEINNCQNVKILNKILVHRKQDFFVKKNSVISSQMMEKKLDKSYIKKEGETLDDLSIQLNPTPNILKIDIHGSEGFMLEGSRDFLKNKVKFILLELHPEDVVNKFSPGYSRKKILKLLSDTNFNCYLISPFKDLDNNEGIYFKKENKCIFLKMNLSEFDLTFFDRSDDALVLAIKKNLNIKDLDCFDHDKSGPNIF